MLQDEVREAASKQRVRAGAAPAADGGAATNGEGS
jgi:hypothetical protein